MLSAADLTPIPLSRSPRVTESSVDGGQGGLRERVEQANKVLSDVVDSSFGMLRSLLPNPTAHNAPAAASTSTSASVPPPVDTTGGGVKPGFGLLRRESKFSIKSITAALPMPISRGTKSGEETGQQLVTVSIGSVPEGSVLEESEDGDEDNDDDDGDDDDDDDDEDEEEGSVRAVGDARSIRSFESMLSARATTKKTKKSGGGPRRSLSDRLAQMSGLSGVKVCPSMVFPTTPLLLITFYLEGITTKRANHKYFPSDFASVVSSCTAYTTFRGM
jgi:hypothetical protein